MRARCAYTEGAAMPIRWVAFFLQLSVPAVHRGNRPPAPRERQAALFRGALAVADQDHAVVVASLQSLLEPDRATAALSPANSPHCRLGH